MVGYNGNMMVQKRIGVAFIVCIILLIVSMTNEYRFFVARSHKNNCKFIYFFSFGIIFQMA